MRMYEVLVEKNMRIQNVHNVKISKIQEEHSQVVVLKVIFYYDH